ncbi:hypothetical protein C0J52_04136 [Blattella germanica]|nr:hypothetical protein C0J52_04136 [Blattella germanica]
MKYKYSGRIKRDAAEITIATVNNVSSRSQRSYATYHRSANQNKHQHARLCHIYVPREANQM